MNADAAVRLQGFTLIEVLVALAIVALGLIGVFGQVSQSATAATRLRDKTFASWVALNKITELRVQGAFPPVSTSSEDAEMANAKWRLELTFADTGTELRRVDIKVAFADRPERPVATATGFLVLKQKGNPQAGSILWVSGGPGPGEQQPPPGTPSPAPVQPPPTETDQGEQ